MIKKRITTINSRTTMQLERRTSARLRTQLKLLLVSHLRDVLKMARIFDGVPKTESTLGLKEAWRITWSHEGRRGPGQEGWLTQETHLPEAEAPVSAKPPSHVFQKVL